MEKADSIGDLLGMYQIVEVNGERKALTTERITQQQLEFGDDNIKVIKSTKGRNTGNSFGNFGRSVRLFYYQSARQCESACIGLTRLIHGNSDSRFRFSRYCRACLSWTIFLGGHRLLNISADYAALAFIVGVGLLLLELFVIPGFGIAGIAGIALMLGSVFFVFRNAYKLETAVFALSSSIILAFAVCHRAFLHLAQNPYMEPSRFECRYGFRFGIPLCTAGEFSGVRG